MKIVNYKIDGEYQNTPLVEEGGSSMLETIIFVPLALLLLFLGIDTGLRFVEQAGVTDLLRANLRIAPELGINSFTSQSTNAISNKRFSRSRLRSYSLVGELEIDKAVLENKTEKIADQMLSEIKKFRSKMIIQNELPFGLEVSSIVVHPGRIAKSDKEFSFSVVHTAIRGDNPSIGAGSSNEIIHSKVAELNLKSEPGEDSSEIFYFSRFIGPSRGLSPGKSSNGKFIDQSWITKAY